MKSNTTYKNYLLRQLGIKESQFKSPLVEDNSFPGIDPDELEKGTEEERDDHDMSGEEAAKTATQHLTQPEQKHYYSGMEKAKNKGMLRDTLSGGPISPTAIATPIIGLAVRGSSTGGFPSGMDQSGISPNTPTGRLGGYEPIPTERANSKLVDKTPSNNTINSSTPVNNDFQPIPETPHPYQIQQNMGNVPQSLTGASTDGNETSSKLKSAVPMGIDVDVDVSDTSDSISGEEGDMNDMDGEEPMEDDAKAGLNEGKHKKGCKCGFCMNKNRFGKKKKKDEKDDGRHVFKKDKETDEEVNETFARHKKMLREKLGLKKESNDFEKNSPITKAELEKIWNDVHPIKTIEPGDEFSGERDDMDEPHQHKLHEPPIRNPETGLSTGAGSPVSDYGMNTELEENDDIDTGICSRCNGSGEGHVDGSKCDCCGGSGKMNGGRQKKSYRLTPSHSDPDYEKDIGVDECGSCGCGKTNTNHQYDESKSSLNESKYTAPFERMRGLAGLGKVTLGSNGLWKNDGASQCKKNPLTITEKLQLYATHFNKKSNAGTLTPKESLLFERVNIALRDKRK